MSSLNESGVTPEVQVSKERCLERAALAVTGALADLAARRQAEAQEVAA